MCTAAITPNTSTTKPYISFHDHFRARSDQDVDHVLVLTQRSEVQRRHILLQTCTHNAAMRDHIHNLIEKIYRNTSAS